MCKGFFAKLLQHFASTHNCDEYIHMAACPLDLGDIVTLQDDNFSLNSTWKNIWKLLPNVASPKQEQGPIDQSFGQQFCYEENSVTGLSVDIPAHTEVAIGLNLEFGTKPALFLKLADDAKFWHYDMDITEILGPKWSEYQEKLELLQRPDPEKMLYVVTGMYKGSGLLAYKKKTHHAVSFGAKFIPAQVGFKFQVIRGSEVFYMKHSYEERYIVPIVRLLPISKIENWVRMRIERVLHGVRERPENEIDIYEEYPGAGFGSWFPSDTENILNAERQRQEKQVGILQEYGSDQHVPTGEGFGGWYPPGMKDILHDERQMPEQQVGIFQEYGRGPRGAGFGGTAHHYRIELGDSQEMESDTAIRLSEKQTTSQSLIGKGVQEQVRLFASAYPGGISDEEIAKKLFNATDDDDVLASGSSLNTKTAKSKRHRKRSSKGSSKTRL